MTRVFNPMNMSVRRRKAKRKIRNKRKNIAILNEMIIVIIVQELALSEEAKKKGERSEERSEKREERCKMTEKRKEKKKNGKDR